ncbi:unnamed protein product [Chondrus crispus]|uniref:Pyridine nucleotide-disulfide oxidoreductase domain-containing protein 1 n=1 Tax=Chondrus crispus TaxID=2769 RepID=R7QHT5_CHOCR|nr:unnamed protein product [Chondrus crispus]CDF37338.1 unnamed protein product [Chondrus crispus]|eukprot:XP_005717157.1 unnamed protein product [Chondrus crispus]
MPAQAVVLGGGVAGATCALELSALTPPDTPLTVTLIDPQPIIKACTLVAKLTRSALDLAISDVDAAEWSRARGIVFVQDRAVAVRDGQVRCQSGAVFRFSACCIATGAAPFSPHALRAAGDSVLTLRDTCSVDSLKRKLAGARRAVVVGAGGIAMELVHEIARCHIVWVMKGTHVGSPFFDKRAAEQLSNVFGLGQLSCESLGDSLPENRDVTGSGSSASPLSAQSTIASSASSNETEKGRNIDAFGAGVGPEWVSRRFQPVLFDKKGKIEIQQPSKYTELEGRSTNSQKIVRIAKECEILRVTKDDAGVWPIVAHLSDGSMVGADVILVGTGVLPNVNWLRGSGIEIDQGFASKREASLSGCPGGILVSAENMSTNVRGLFAAGDCTTVRLDTVGADWIQMRLWSQAQTAGRACAQSMARYLQGEPAACLGLDFDVFAHATQFFNKKVVLLGRYNAQGVKDDYRMVESGGERGDDHYIRVVLVNGRVRGAILVGEVDKAETFENLILDGLDVSQLEAELVDPSIDLEDYFD